MSDWRSLFSAPLAEGWYARPTRRVARDLLGCTLIRRRGGRWRAGRIVETEAYVANDRASHAFRGETPRNHSMFGGPGTLYVYRIHQVHCANIVTRPGEAVLLRAVAPLTGTGGNGTGPGRLCRWMEIDRSDDGLNVTEGQLRIVPGSGSSRRIVRGPRVGIRLNRNARLRFALSGEPSVSSPRPPGWRPRADQRSFAQS